MIPLHAVRSGPEEYVALRWPVCYLPTFALLPLKRPTTATRRVLLAGCERDGFGSPTLPGVKEELNEIQKTWSDLDSQNLIRRHLEPEENLESAGIPLDRWAEFDLLHVACHGVFPDGRPFDAALRLGSQALRTSQFFGVRIDASLAAFSACSVGRSAESAAGQRVVGDEWLGFCLPLLYSGVGSVLASLWNANSEQAALLMLHLHRALHQGDSPVVALHKALDERIGPCPEACWANWYVVGFPG
jgi:CHAT domain-containing protein